jgi:hypothetical protein
LDWSNKELYKAGSGIIVAKTQAKLVPPPPPQHYCACVWGSSHICASVLTASPPTEIHVQYFTGLLFVQTLPRMPPPHW